MTAPIAQTTPPPLHILLAAPRGFCAGVDRAIKIVELALEKWGAPVYVRHEIVHNRYVVDGLREKGAVFVEELDECPPDRPVVFSAHGVPKSVPAAAEARQMLFVDATCPLVSKVHIEAERHHAAGLQIVMIGHDGHPETIGTMGQLPEGEVLLVETPADVAGLAVRDPARLAYVTQTTLSVDDTAEIAAALRARGLPVKLVAPIAPKTDLAKRAAGTFDGEVLESGDSLHGAVFVDAMFGIGLSRPLTRPRLRQSAPMRKYVSG